MNTPTLSVRTTTEYVFSIPRNSVARDLSDAMRTIHDWLTKNGIPLTDDAYTVTTDDESILFVIRDNTTSAVVDAEETYVPGRDPRERTPKGDAPFKERDYPTTPDQEAGR